MAYNTISPVQRRKEFRIQLVGCTHCTKDDAEGRDSITEAFEANYYNGIYSDIAICHGDFYATADPVESPTNDADGVIISNQLNEGSKFNRENVYTLRGNHDAGAGNYDVYNKYVDDFGENTVTSGVNNSLRPHNIIRNGSDEGYYAFINNNAIFFIIGDRNEMAAPVGRDGSPASGYPSGAMSRDCWEFIKAQIALHPNKTAFVHAHHLLKDTTLATPDNDGVNGGWHSPLGKPEASGRLEDIWDDDTDTSSNASEIVTWMTNNPGKIFMWCGAHTHCYINETYNGKSQYEQVYGTHFLNVGSASLHHSGRDALTRVMLFQEGSAELNIFQFVISSTTEDDKQIYHPNTLTLTMPNTF